MSNLKHIPYLILLFVLGMSTVANAQMTQFCIGGPGNEMATKIVYMASDNSTIIAGYSYDIVGGAARNAQALIMKVTSTGTIAWQKTYGNAGRNSIISDMIITQDNNIVVVGRVNGSGALYSDNTAGILKFNSTNGNLMWQSCFRATPATAGGELFMGVTELTDGTNRLVAVGAHNGTPSGSGGMVCVYSGIGSLIYNEVFDIASGDEYEAVTTSAAGNSVYICGEFVGNYKDGQVISYTPGATSGVVNWQKNFDFFLMGTLQDDFFSKIFLRGSTLVLGGGCLHNYSLTSGQGNFVATMSAVDGSGMQIKAVQNSGATYGNSYGMAVLSADHVFFAQSPTNTSFIDPMLWTPAVTVNSVITDITSISAGTSNTPIKFNSTAVGQHAILDMQYNSGSLYMAGSTNITLGFGNNDIYFVNTSTNLASVNHSCDTAHDVVAITNTPFTSPTPFINHFTYTPAYFTVDTGTSHLSILAICGDLMIPDTVCNTLTLPDSLVACSGTTVTLPGTVSGGDPVLSYTWTPATGLSSSTVLHPTLTGAVSGWYHLTVKSVLPGNSLVNGDFTAGNTGFASSYTVEVPGPLSTPGNYAVTNNPALYDASFPAFGDHTGAGNMMLVDGSPSAGLSFWCETVLVTPNTDYVFSFWTSLVHLPLPSIQVSMNGTPMGGTFAPSATAGVWTQYRVPWNSGLSTSVNICMSDMNNVAFGNDFAVDDLEFQTICTAEDSIYVNVDFSDTLIGASIDSISCFSSGNSLVITAPSGYSSYLWNVGNTTQSIAAPGGTYWVFCTNNCSTLLDTFHVTLLNDTLKLFNPDTAICRGKSVQVRLGGNPAVSYQWLPTAGIPNSTLLTPLITPDTSALYTVTASMAGCPDLTASFYIDVQPVPVVYAGGNRQVCEFDTLHLQAAVTPNWYTHYTYNWVPGGNLVDDSTTSTVVFHAGDSTKIILTVTTPAGCIGKDSALIIVHPGNFAHLDTSINVCPGDSAQLTPWGGVSYQWHPGMYLDDSAASQPWVHAITSQYYKVIATSQYGCTDTVGASVVVRPNAVIHIPDSVSLYPGESYHIEPATNCSYFTWFPPTGLDYYRISDPTASPQIETKYYVHASTEWGCKAVDSISIFLNETVLAIPNAFTPGSDVNNYLYLIKRGTATLNYLRIWNRWGNLVFETSNINQGWDGTYKGVPQPFGVYVYQLEAVTNAGRKFTKHGNVTLIR